MKAIYKKTVVDRIQEIIYESHKANKLIDYILVTPSEFDELRAFGGQYVNYNYSMGRTHSAETIPSFNTVNVEIPRTVASKYHGARHYRAILSAVVCCGQRIAIVPEDLLTV